MWDLELYIIMFLFAIVNHFMSRHPSLLISGLIPFTFIFLLILNFIFNWVDYRQPMFIVISVIIFFILFGEWMDGREDFKRKIIEGSEKIDKKNM